jgi:hypothetical protein
MDKVKYEIYQMKERQPYLYCPWDEAKKQYKEDHYKKVYEGTLDNIRTCLEDLFTKFNEDIPTDFTGHSMSVGDIVKIEGSVIDSDGLYYCDIIGFKKIRKLS